MSNVERQRAFRARHPGYFNKYKRRRSRAKTPKIRVTPPPSAEQADALNAPSASLALRLPAAIDPPLIPGTNTTPATAPIEHPLSLPTPTPQDDARSAAA